MSLAYEIHSAGSYVTLIARREPSFHGAHETSFPSGGALTASPSGFTRFVSTLQIVGTVLGVPLGLASGYSIYRANFSVETSCQSLRGNIVALLDRSVDAATRRILVRRDVTAFEQSCGAIDPDAVAAFKTLLAVDKASTAAAPKPRTAAPPVEVARKAEPQPAVAEPVERAAAVSDTKWLAAVRQALVEHGPERAAQPERPLRPDAAKSETAAPAKAPAPILQQAWIVPPSMPIVPPQAVSAPAISEQGLRAPRQNVDHPVPPESIPGPPPLSLEPKEAGGERSRLGAWIAEIPLLGPAIERARN